MIRRATRLLAALCAFTSGCAPAASPGSPHEAEARACEARGELRAALTHYVAAIQALPEGDASPKDRELREKAIRLALALDPPPAVPDDVQRLLARAEAAVRQASNEAAWSQAAADYEQALRCAPWDPRGNYNLGLLHELLKRPAPAAKHLGLYVAAAPGAADRADVQRKIAELEAKARRNTGIPALVGSWRMYDDQGKLIPQAHYRLEARGRKLGWIIVHDQAEGFFYKGMEIEAYLTELEGRRIRGRLWSGDTPGYFNGGLIEGTVSEDFQEISFRVMDRDGDRAVMGTLRRTD